MENQNLMPKETWRKIEVITAMVTPFAPNGEVDYLLAKHLALHLAQSGSDGILVGGTTGESPTLTNEEKLLLFKTVKEAVEGKTKIIAGTGTNSTTATIRFSKEAEDIGVDALLLVVPYYNKPPQQGLINHFALAAKSTKLPVILYNVPGRTGTNMTPETVGKLAQLPNIIGIKEASGNLDQVSQIKQLAGDFIIWSGDDSLTLPMLSLGAVGVISVASHLVGKELKEMIRLFKAGKVETAQYSHESLLPFFRACFITTNPIPIKEALNMTGWPVGKVRPPLIDLTEEEKVRLMNTLIPLGLMEKLQI